jgi:hypothetical protein
MKRLTSGTDVTVAERDESAERGHTAAVSIGGSVTTATKRPLSGATVVVRRLGLAADTEVERTETRPDGSYEVELELTVNYETAGGSAVLVVTVLDAKGREVARRGPISASEGLTSIDLVIPGAAPAAAEFDRLREDMTISAARSGLSLADLHDTEERPDVLVLARSLGASPTSVRSLLAAHSAARSLVGDAAGAPAPRVTKAGSAARPAVRRRGAVLSEQSAAALLYRLWSTTAAPQLSDLLDRSNADLEPQLRQAVADGVVSAGAGAQIPAFLAALDAQRASRLATPPPTRAGERQDPFAAALALVVRDDATRQVVAEAAVRHGTGTDAFWAALPKNAAVPTGTAEQLRTAVAFLNVSGGHVRLLDRLADRGALTPAGLAEITVAGWKSLLRSKTRTGEVVGAVGAAPARVPDAETLARQAAVLDTAVEALYPTEHFVSRLKRDTHTSRPLVQARDDIETFVANNPDFHVRDTPLEGLLADAKRSRRQRTKGMADPDAALALIKGVQRVFRLLPDAPAVELEAPGTHEPVGIAPFDRYDVAARLVADGVDSAPAIAASPRGWFIDTYTGPLRGPENAVMLYTKARAVTDSSIIKALDVHELAFPSIASAQPTFASWRSLFGSVDMCECEHCSSMISPAAYLFDCLKLLQDGPLVAGRTPLDVLLQRRPDLVRLGLTCDNTDTKMPYVDLVNEILERAVAPRWFQPFQLTTATAADLAAGIATDALRAAFLANGSWTLSANAQVDIVVRRPGGGVRTWHVLDAGRLFEVQQSGATLTVVTLTFQTVGTEEELRAAPAHVVSRAYDTLAGEVFPWHLSFSINHAETQAYLSAIHTSVEAVIAAFQNGGALEAARRDDVAASHLGLSPDEYAIIAGLKVAGNGPITLGAPADRPADFWGAKAGIVEVVPTGGGMPPISGSWDTVLSYVPLFLKRSELSYIELLQLLDCYFINPVVDPGAAIVIGDPIGPAGGAHTPPIGLPAHSPVGLTVSEAPRRKISIVSINPKDPASCELDLLVMKGLDVATLTRIHRYVRLARALRWEFVDLDRALTALGATDLDSDTVVALTLLDRLSTDTGWPVRELSALLGDLDHASYLDRRDTSQSVLPSLYDELFRKNPQVSTPDPSFVADPGALAGKAVDHRAALMAALTVSGIDLDALLADTRVVPAAADLTLANISALYRHAAVASLLGLTTTDLLAVLDVVGTDPLALGGASLLDRAYAIWSFLARTRTLLASTPDARTLHYLLVDDGTTPDQLDFTDAEIAQVLESLRATLGKLVADTTFAPDSTGRTIAQELVKLGWALQDATAAQAFFAETETYAIPLDEAFKPAGLPPDARLRYHELTGELRCVGTLTAAETVRFTTGLAHASQEYIDAVNELADRPRRYAKSALQWIAPPTWSVPLTALPDALVIPAALRRNLKFDPIAQRLRFRGDRSLLDQLTVPAGPAGLQWTRFKAALGDLRADPTPGHVDVDPPAAENRFFVDDPTRDAFNDAVSDPATRCSLALAAIVKAVWNVSAPGAAAQVLASSLDIDGPSAMAALPAWGSLAFDPTDHGPSDLVLSATPFTSAAFPTQFATIRRLHKLGVLLTALEVQPELAPWLTSRGRDVLGFDPAALPAAPGDAPVPVDGYESAAALVRLIKSTKADVARVTGLFELMSGSFTRDAWCAAVGALFGVDASIVDGLTTSPAVSVASARSPQFYLGLQARLRLRRQTGVSARDLTDWAASFSMRAGVGWAGEFTQSRASAVKLAVQAMFKRDRWLSVSTEIQDVLRERKRDALVSYLLSRPLATGEMLRNDADLFAHFLIDAEMESCMTTSRLKQAISSVQTFVQRVILNLEPAATLDPDVADRWREWQGRYRLWEANRKIIVTPEFWIEPSLRDNMSQAYKSFESRLLQVELTDTSAWEALGHFASARYEIANLEVCAVYEQDVYATGAGTTKRILHAFARTRGKPGKYYHRTRVVSQVDSLGTWSPWQKLDLDIEGDHLLTISFGRRLYLIWPLIREHAVPDTRGLGVDGTNFEIGIAWSTFDGTSWSPKSISPKNTVVAHTASKDAAHPDALDPLKAFTFQVSADPNGVRVWVYALERTTASTTTTTTITPSPVVATSFSLDLKKPFPFLEVHLTLAGAQAADGAALATLSTMGAASLVPLGTWVMLGATFISPPVVVGPVIGDTRVTKIAVDGAALFGVYPVWTPEIVQGRSATLDAVILDPLVGMRTVGPLTMDEWLLAPFAQVRVDVDFPQATVTTTTDVQTTTKIVGIGNLFLHNNGRVENHQWGLVELQPPGRTLPEGQWWREDPDQSQSDTFVLPGQLVPVFQQTPGQYRLLPAALAGPIQNRLQFAFEDSDKTYLVERSYGHATVPPTFTTFFDANAEAIRDAIVYDPGTALSRDIQQHSDDLGQGFRTLFGGPGNTVAPTSFPTEKIEFERHEVFSGENWETFFHAPLELAGLLTRHNRFADAQKLLHAIYNPLSAKASDAAPWEAWQFLPFYQTAKAMAHTPQPSVYATLAAEAANLETRLTWQENPFSPYAVARLRISAFMKNTVLRYLDNLIAWGDRLYRQDTIESINEATQLYLLAEQILGEPPETVPARARPVVQTFQSLSDAGQTATGASALGLLLVEISAFIEPNSSAAATGGSLGTMPYFCVPQNEGLRDYWKTVQGRLQKIRRCEDISGRRRELDLFEPAIDPAILVRAKAAGVDIGSILNDLYAPPPHYRYTVLAPKAAELVNEVRSLGAALLTALEKQDAEALARLKQSQELINLSNTKDIREKQVDEALAQVKALAKSRDLASLRFRYYQRLLGDATASTPGRGDPVKLADYLPASTPIGAGASDQQGLQLAQHENQQIELLDEANGFMLASNIVRTIAGVLHAIPNTTLPLSYGGMHVGSAADAAASVLQLVSANFSHQASRLGMVGGFVRRQDDWTLQRNAAAQELSQLDAQLDAADLRVEIARLELRNHETLTEQSEAIQSFFNEKHTTEELYEWMIDQVAGLYYQSYELAYRVAKQAEAAWRRDLGVVSSAWVNFGHWDALKRGLLAGESLALDLKRMDVAYFEQNAREYEITKHISLVSLDPNAFLDLKTTGSCTFEVPEWLFDQDHPGHYLRRIRNASVTVPCVVGPYASVNARVTLESSWIRMDPDSSADYERKIRGDDIDPRFVYVRGASESIVTSSGQADSGLFEVNLRDDRYLPFESHGAASRWTAEIMAADNGLVLESATDFILHLRYTARDGGADLERIARAAVDKRVAGPKASLFRMLSLRHEYPTEWNKFTKAGGTIGPLDLTNRIPALYARRAVTVGKDRAYFAVTGDTISQLDAGAQHVHLASTSTAISVAQPNADSIDLTGLAPDDLLIVVPYVVGSR